MLFINKRKKPLLCSECEKYPPNMSGLDTYLICDKCRANMGIPYLKNQSDKKPERVGKIKI